MSSPPRIVINNRLNDLSGLGQNRCLSWEGGWAWGSSGSCWNLNGHSTHPGTLATQPVGERMGKQEGGKGMVMAQRGEVTGLWSYSYCMVEVGALA